MNTTVSKRIVLLILAAILMTPVWSQGNQSHPQSGIHGRVLVEQVLPHLRWHVRITTDSGKLVTDVSTAADGSFTVNLKPGSYVLTPHAAGGTRIGLAIQLLVQKKKFTEAQLPLILVALPWPWPLPGSGDVTLWAIPH